jgi:hypothetical protein
VAAVGVPAGQMHDTCPRDRLETSTPAFRLLNIAWLSLGFAVALSFGGLLLGQVEATRGDSFGQLVVAQSIIKNGTIELDRYRGFFQKDDGSYDVDVMWRAGHLYHYFPVGVPLLTLPVVALANLAGFDMRDYDSAMQRLLGAATGAMIVLLVALIGRIYFPTPVAAGVAILALFGTVIGPTVGMALSTNGFEIVFVGAAALLLLLRAQGRRVSGLAWLVGVTVFLAYICRPTAVAAILPIFAYLLVTDRKTLRICAGVSAALFLLFMYWSHSEYGTLLPPYYSAGRLSLAHVGEALRGTFLGASRNILIFNPFLPVLAVLAWSARRLPREALLLPITFFAIGLGLFAINMASPDWTGLWSYGPRLSCTMAFTFFICCLCLLGELTKRNLADRRQLALLTMTLMVGLIINLPGLYNAYTWYWNSFPNITQHPDAVASDWRFPQFTASRSALIEKNRVQSEEFGLPADVFVPLRGTILLVGGAAPGSSEKFALVRSGRRAVLAFRVLNIGLQAVSVSVNGTPVSEKSLSTGSASFSIDVPASVFVDSPDGNQVSFDAPRRDGPGVLVLGYSLRFAEPASRD